MRRLKFQRVAKQFDRSAFDCGVPRVNHYLQREAGQHDRNRNVNTWLLVTPSNEVVAFVSTKLTQVRLEAFSDRDQSILNTFAKRGESTALLIAWLGVDLRYARLGIGEVLINKCVRDARSLDELAPCIGLLTDPLTAESKSYFIKKGFDELVGTERLFFQL